MSSEKELIEKTLSEGTDNIKLEPIPQVEASPLTQPVVEKAVSYEQPPAETKEPQETNNTTTTAEEKQAAKEPVKEEPLDAPEQEINDKADTKQPPVTDENPEFNIPIGHASQLADTFLGVTNNLLEVSTGYFINIRKHKDFYDFDEIIEIIEEQNVKNIKRIKLDEEDKALLRPLIIRIIRKKAKVLSPEKQLLAALISIIIKKAKIIAEIRVENDVLVERIRDIIRQERNYSPTQPVQENPEKAEPVKEEKKSEETTVQPQANTGLPNQVLEVAEEVND